MRTPGESWSRLFRSLEGGADLHLSGEHPTVVSAPRALPLYLPGLLPRRPHPYIDEVLLKVPYEGDSLRRVEDCRCLYPGFRERQPVRTRACPVGCLYKPV